MANNKIAFVARPTIFVDARFECGYSKFHASPESRHRQAAGSECGPSRPGKAAKSCRFAGIGL